jgi:ATP-dependent Clp protease adaptor protein ClpS
MREVLVFDDDYTPMEFVVTVLEQVIQKSREEASTIMMQAHHDGFAISGLYAPAQARDLACAAEALAREADTRCASESRTPDRRTVRAPVSDHSARSGALLARFASGPSGEMSLPQRRRDVAAIDGGDVGGGLERQRLGQEGLRHILRGDLAAEQVAAHIVLLGEAAGGRT